MNCGVCNNIYTKIYKLPLYYCPNCYLIKYVKQIEKKNDDYLIRLKSFTKKLLVKNNNLKFSTINYMLNFDLTVFEEFQEDTLFIVHHTDFLLTEEFNRSCYVFNDYSDSYFFNYNSIKLLADKYKFEVSCMDKMDEFIYFKAKKKTVFENTIVDLFIYDDIVNNLYEEDTVLNFYLNYLHFKNIKQNEMIKYIKLKGDKFIEKNNYTVLFSILSLNY